MVKNNSNTIFIAIEEYQALESPSPLVHKILIFNLFLVLISYYQPLNNPASSSLFY
ncbi:hypothetical protein DJ66_0221 [Candidatus Liberibacter solanacearum]|uniref:Uncharacterized protein n=1 Tax=Candidatus Liberibacter solanacearum TaxID=556287 RepID=A0A0F4VPK7_9HYPH|nr:hypothetical protein DJ66_0221 [Candidatus Liberibacter solanacearum]